VCDSGHWLDRRWQSVSQGLGTGHIDGVSASYCTVPSTITWISAGLVVAGGIAIAAAVATGRRSAG
jgi:hypothetical protein